MLEYRVRIVLLLAIMVLVIVAIMHLISISTVAYLAYAQESPMQAPLSDLSVPCRAVFGVFRVDHGLPWSCMQAQRLPRMMPRPVLIQGLYSD